MTVQFSDRIDAFATLGDILHEILTENMAISDPFYRYKGVLEESIGTQYQANRWFTPGFIRDALDAIVGMLNKADLQKIKERYGEDEKLDLNRNRKVAVISAGNIPVAAFHDFFSVLVSGNRYIGKLSSQDKVLLPVIADMLTEIEPDFRGKILFVDRLPEFDMIIATGSDNSARYFDYYFGKYPHILRKNRNSIAVLSGRETEAELVRLSGDVFTYFGLGCRSVSKIFIPENYDFVPLTTVFDENTKDIAMHNQYLNNIDYQKALHLMNRIPYIDAGALLLEENEQLSSPIGVLYFQYYHGIDEVVSYIEKNREDIQCVASNMPEIENRVALGATQCPAVFDFADGRDVILFLASKETV